MRHHLALSIVGIDHVPSGYYQGKLLQERLVAEGEVPWTILRATQFHEFAEQALGYVRIGPFSIVPRMVASRSPRSRLPRLWSTWRRRGRPAGCPTSPAPRSSSWSTSPAGSRGHGASAGASYRCGFLGRWARSCGQEACSRRPTARAAG